MSKEIANLFVKIGADIKDFQSKFGQVGKTTSQMDKQFSGIANTLNTKTNLAVANAAQQYKIWEQTAGKNATQQEKLKQQLQMQQTQLAATTQSVHQHRQAYMAAAAAYGKNSTKAMQMQQSLGAAVIQQNQLGASVRTTQTQLNRSNTMYGRAANAIQGMNVAGMNFSGKVGPAIGIAAGVAVAGGFFKAVNTSADFNQELVKAGSLAGASEKQLKQLGAGITEVSSKSAFTAKEVAIASQSLVRLGFNVDQVTDSLGGVVSASEATGTSVDLTAELIASSINVWNKQASAADHLADVYTKASNSTATSVYDLTYAFKYAGPHASALGISIEQLTAMVGELGNKGIKGEQAGTALRYAFGQLASESDNVKKGLKKVNVELKDSEGKMRPVLDVLGDLETAIKPYTGDKKIQILSDMFGVEAAPAIMNLLDTGIDKVRQTTRELEMSGGTAQKTAEQMKNSYRGAMLEMQSSWETFQINLGKSGEGFAKHLAKQGNEILSFFNGIYSDLTKEYETYIDAVDHEEWLSNAKAAAENATLVKVEEFAKQTKANTEAQEKQMTDYMNYLDTRSQVTEEGTKKHLETMQTQYDQEREQFTGHQQAVIGKVEEHIGQLDGLKQKEKEVVLKQVKEKKKEELKSYDELAKERTELVKNMSSMEVGEREQAKTRVLQIEEELKTKTIKAAGLTEQQVTAAEVRLRTAKGKERAQAAGEAVEAANKEYKGTMEKATALYNEKMAVVRELRSQGTKEANDLADKMESAAERELTEVSTKAFELKEQKIQAAREAAQEVGAQVDEEGRVMTGAWSKLVSWFASNPIVMTIKKVGEAWAEGGPKAAATETIKQGVQYIHRKNKRAATGGIFSGPTQALIGEAGTEAVVPLSNKKKVAPFANAVAAAMGGGGSHGGIGTYTSTPPVEVNIPVVLNGREIAKATVADMMSEIDRKEKINRRGAGLV